MIEDGFFSNVVDMIDEAESTGAPGIIKLAAVQTTLRSLLGRDDYERYGPMLKIVIDGIVSMKKTMGTPVPVTEPAQKKRFPRLSRVFKCLRIFRLGYTRRT